MAKNNFTPKQEKLIFEILYALYENGGSHTIQIPAEYSNKIIRKTLHQLGFDTNAKKLKNKKIKIYPLYKTTTSK